MARPQKRRKILTPPKMKGFKPFGLVSKKTEKIILNFEEYESIKLVEYDMLPQNKAAELMNISRPTLTRIYNKAIKKIAKAFVEGKSIDIHGGNYQFDNDWYRCKKCYKLIEGIDNHIKCESCDDFDNDELINLNN